MEQTSILVTHDIATTMNIADYIYFISDGNIVAHGTPAEMQNTPDKAVHQFIKGEINGPYAFEYPTNLDYQKYMGT